MDFFITSTKQSTAGFLVFKCCIIIILRCLEVVNELCVSTLMSPSDKWHCNDTRITDEDEISTAIPGTSVLRVQGGT